MTKCENCEEIIEAGNTETVVSGSGVYCDIPCWEEDYGQPWPHRS